MKKTSDPAWAFQAGHFPTTPIVWPADRQKSNQIQQIKGSSKPQATFVLPSTQPNTAYVPPRTTPQHVSNVRVISQKAVAGNKTVTVQFNHPSNDPYFSGANVYLRRAGQQPTLVASGAKSPLTFTVPVHTASHVIHVTSTGNWGETSVATSPARPVRLV
jgi:hypothetical protein